MSLRAKLSRALLALIVACSLCPLPAYADDVDASASSSLPAETAAPDEQGVEAEADAAALPADEGVPDEAEAAAWAAPPDEGASSSEEAGVDATARAAEEADDLAKSADVEEPAASESVGFVYFDLEAPAVGQTQTVVVATDNEADVLASGTLELASPSGERIEVASVGADGNALAFELAVEEAGDYVLKTAQVKTASGDVRTLSLAADGQPCSFGAVEPQAGIEALAQVDGAENMDVAVYSLDEDGELAPAASLEQTAAEAASEVARVSARSARARNDEFVVALDAGHGGNDGGASAYGLKESDVTWGITTYCKQYLEAHSKARVVLVRGKNENPGLSERVQRAVNQGADVFVSLHINSAAATSAQGAEVWYPNNSSYRNDLHVEGNKLASSIQQRLVALGLKDRGVKVKNATGAWYYPDGSLQDYYTVIQRSREAGIVGIIVEHAFISNKEENAKLATASFQKQLGYADAQGIIAAYGIGGSGSGSGGGNSVPDMSAPSPWVQENGRWKLKDPGGAFVKSQWQRVDGKWYYFDANGYALTGFQTVEGSRYYFDSDCVMRTGWFTVGKTWHYANPSGALVTGWATIGGARYYLKPGNGAMASGVQKINGTWHVFQPSGALVTGKGWKKAGGKWYYFNASGAPATGWKKLSGTWYYLNPTTGIMATGWTLVDGKWYWMYSSGAMRGKGWLKLKGKWYYLTSSGAMKTGWLKLSGTWYYLWSSGVMASGGWRQVGNETYWFAGSGAMRTQGWFKQGGHWYYITSSGARATGWKTIGGKKYYFWYTTGCMATGTPVIGNERFQFDSSGALVKSLGRVQTAVTAKPSQSSAPAKPAASSSAIMGASLATVNQMVADFNSTGKPYPAYKYAKKGAPTIRDFCTILLAEAKAEGVRAEVVFCQAMKETGWLQFGGSVDANGKVQCNFAGLGATSATVGGATFANVREGLRAQVQHLKAYASTAPLKNKCVDPRFSLVTRGIAPNLEDLNGRWAVPGDGYGESILGMIGVLLKK